MCETTTKLLQKSHPSARFLFDVSFEMLYHRNFNMNHSANHSNALSCIINIQFIYFCLRKHLPEELISVSFKQNTPIVSPVIPLFHRTRHMVIGKQFARTWRRCMECIFVMALSELVADFTWSLWYFRRVILGQNTAMTSGKTTDGDCLGPRIALSTATGVSSNRNQ